MIKSKFSLSFLKKLNKFLNYDLCIALVLHIYVISDFSEYNIIYKVYLSQDFIYCHVCLYFTFI